MSQDTAPRYRYAVTLEIVLEVEADSEAQATDYAEERLKDMVSPEVLLLWRVADVEREGV